MQQLIDFLAPATVVAAAVAGLISALDQLTSRSRLRRWAAFLREESLSAPAAHDRVVLDSLRRDVLSRMVSREAVPTRTFFLPLAGTLLLLIGWGATGFVLGEAAAENGSLSWERLLDVAGLEGLSMLGFSPFFVGATWLQFGVPPIVARRRIARQYISAEMLERRPVEFDVAGRVYSTDSVRYNRALGLAGFLGFIGGPVGVSLFALAAGLLLGARSTVDSVLAMAILAMMLASVCTSLSATAVYVRLDDVEAKPVWHHPRPGTRRPRSARAPAHQQTEFSTRSSKFRSRRRPRSGSWELPRGTPRAN